MNDKHISFWGRTLEDYNAMFNLKPLSNSINIVSIADGPSTVNLELRNKGFNFKSVDPVYGFSLDEIERYFSESFEYNKTFFYNNKDKFVFGDSIEITKILSKRKETYESFIQDFKINKADYIVGSLPALPFSNQSFDLCLCSNFLFLFDDSFDLNFHFLSIQEMLRISKELRIFPIYNRQGNTSVFFNRVLDFLNERGYIWSLQESKYEIYKGQHNYLQIAHSL